MSQYRNGKFVGEWFIAGIAAALGMLLCSPGALAEDVPNAPATNEAALPPLPQNLARVPAPAVAPPVNRKKPELVHVELEAKPVTGLLTDGTGYQYWTFNGTVPGPMIRVRQGDTVELTLKNSSESPVSHSIDSIRSPSNAPFASTSLGSLSAALNISMTRTVGVGNSLVLRKYA
jgi:FtsP/CotA-like multicopper oxidase with cupredoxin domain